VLEKQCGDLLQGGGPSRLQHLSKMKEQNNSSARLLLNLQKDLDRAHSQLSRFAEFIIQSVVKLKKSSYEKQWIKPDLSNLQDFLALLQEMLC
jgi:hypothetical protein